jgi:hypothetical protein
MVMMAVVAVVSVVPVRMFLIIAASTAGARIVPGALLILISISSFGAVSITALSLAISFLGPIAGILKFVIARLRSTISRGLPVYRGQYKKLVNNK